MTARPTGLFLASLLLLLAAGPSIRAASREPLDAGAAGSLLVVQGIPLPEGAEPSLAASMSLENLQVVLPRDTSLGKGRMRAVVYQIHREVPLDNLAVFYQQVMTGPFAVRPPVRPAAKPEESEQGDADSIRVLPLQQPAGYLAVRSKEQDSPALVTVALVQGEASPERVLRAIDALREQSGEIGTVEKNPLQWPEKWESEFTFKGIQLQLLQNSLLQPRPRAGVPPGPEIDVMRSLFNQAQQMSLQQHSFAPPVSSVKVLHACLREARRERWRLLSVEAQDRQTVTALYWLPENRGMVMLNARPGPLKDVTPAGSPVPIRSPATLVSRLEVLGPIKLQALFQPVTTQRTAPTAPPIGPPVQQRQQRSPGLTSPRSPR